MMDLGSKFELPGGLDLSVVASNAANDPVRRNLLKFLGIGDFEQEPVVEHIAEWHKNGLPASVSRSALVSQIKFLQTAGWKKPKGQYF